jgi:tRNA modification GTPase
LSPCAARREIAIVSPHAGTTRDVIETSLDVGGYACTLSDTAGIRSTADVVEQLGVDRARAHMAAADVRLHVTDTDTDAHRLLAATVDTASFDIVVRNKIDAAPCLLRHERLVRLSCHTGAGVDELLARLSTSVRRIIDGDDESASSARVWPLLTRERHRRVLTDVVTALDAALLAARDVLSIVLLSDELRVVLRALDSLDASGGARTHTDEVLDVIFREFCIGK